MQEDELEHEGLEAECLFREIHGRPSNDTWQDDQTNNSSKN